MKKNIFAMLAVLLALASCRNAGEPLDYVDPTIGGVSVLLQPTRPTVQVPNEMIRWSPARRDLLDDQISDFPLTLASHRQQSVFGFLPIAASSALSDPFRYKQVYDGEKTVPYLYTSGLEGCSIRFAASKKSGIVEVRFDSPSADNAFRFNTLGMPGSFELVDDHTVTGECTFAGMKAYMYFETDGPVNELARKSASRGLLVGTADSAQTLCGRYGISYISVDQAKANLRNEITDFNLDAVADAAKSVWQDKLGKISVSGGTDTHKRIFYTALYRCFERMVDINEYGQYYSSFDNQVHTDDTPFFTDNWMWDTYIALEPLQTILDPEKEALKVDSYLRMYRQCGNMPSFAVIWGDWAAMTGNYAAVWMADCWSKGIRFDLDTALEGCRKNSVDATLIPWRNGPRTAIDDFYNEHGYFPALHRNEDETIPEVDTKWERRQAVSITTAFSYADWAISQLAAYAGKDEDVALFKERAAFYKNVYRPEKGMFWPKDAEGNWIDGTDPRYMDRMYYTENNAYTFMWDVKHDIYGLFDLMGGLEEAERKLDDMFRIPITMSKFEFYKILPDATGMVGQFAMGNEPSFHIPYLYNYMGSPWKTQKRIHQLIDMLFYDDVMGLPGDEDGGGMSAFVVFSKMGFFPVTPGVPVYAIGSPFFETATISLPDGKKFTVKARNFSEENKYIQSAKLNGKPLERSWFSHSELVGGGVLELTMGPEPAPSWGSDLSQLPPSSIDFTLDSAL